MVKGPDEDAKWLFGGENGENGQWEAHRRFISESYNPIYRQGMVSAHQLSEAAFSEFLSKARTDVLAAAKVFLAWVATERPQGGDYGDVAIERLAARASSFDAKTALGILSVFAEVMDEYDRLRPKREMFIDHWETTEGIIRTFRSSVRGFDVKTLSHHLARQGQAISWLTGSLGRGELWDHGLVGDQKRDVGMHLLDQTSLRDYLSLLANRLCRLRGNELVMLPRLGRVLFTIHDSPWHAAQKEAILRRLAGPRTSNERFISFLEAMAGIVISSDRGVYLKLSITDLHTLLGEENFDRRWSRLLNAPLEPALEVRRSKIKTMFAEAKRW